MKAMITLMLLVLPQDTEVTPQDAEKALQEALKTSVDAGGIEIRGRVEIEDDDSMFGGIRIGFGGQGYTGGFTAKVDASGTIHVVAEADDGKIEIFGNGDRWVKRQTWVGAAQSADGFAKEAMSLVDLANLNENAKRFKKVKAGRDAKVDGVECRTYTAKLPKRVLLDDPSVEEGPFGGVMRTGLWKLEEIDAKFWVSKDDGRIVKVRTSLTHGLSGMVRFSGGPGGFGPGRDDEDEDDEDDEDKDDEDDEDKGGMFPGIGDMKQMRIFTIKSIKYNPDLKIEIPKDVKKFLEE